MQWMYVCTLLDSISKSSLVLSKSTIMCIALQVAATIYSSSFIYETNNNFFVILNLIFFKNNKSFITLHAIYPISSYSLYLPAPSILHFILFALHMNLLELVQVFFNLLNFQSKQIICIRNVNLYMYALMRNIP